jgi:hypothetical protein
MSSNIRGGCATPVLGSLTADIKPPSPKSLQSGSDGSSELSLKVAKTSENSNGIEKILSMVLGFGEVQAIDITRFQFDRSFRVSYFDIRAARCARSSIANGTVPELALVTCHPVDSLFTVNLEDIPHRSSIEGRSVDVSGIPAWDEKYKELMITVFSKFGEVECISHNSEDVFRVLFFDSRSPLAVQAALYNERLYTDRVQVSSEQMVQLLLAGSSTFGCVPVKPVAPDGTFPERNSQKNTAEFAIFVAKLENGEEERTTVMIRNIPRSFSQRAVIELLRMRLSSRMDLMGEDMFNFLYLPMDLVNRVNVGYAFINFTKPQYVIDCYRLFNSKTWRTVIEAAGLPRIEDPEMSKVARVSFARIQGRDNLMGHFNKSSIMLNHPESVRPYFL